MTIDTRRSKLLAIDESLLVKMLGDNGWVPFLRFDDPLASEAVVTGVHYNMSRGQWMIRLTHSGWPEAEPGCELEVITPEIMFARFMTDASGRLVSVCPKCGDVHKL